MAYFANGSEGEILDDQCAECKLSNDADCPVLWVQLTYNYKQLDKGSEILREAMNCLIADKGICQMKKCMDEHLTISTED